MTDIQTRPFSKNYSGLINQSVIALSIALICITSQELMKRKRRGKKWPDGLGSRESWEFGYLYQGRSWARFASPPTPPGWPLSWIKQALRFPEDKYNELRGVDATLYIRFLRGCFWFCLLQSLTTFLILFPIHVRFSDDTISPKSMTRASISSLVTAPNGLSLLWIHICLLFWITLTWIATLVWICRGAFQLRAQNIDAAAQRVAANIDAEKPVPFYPHPHPGYNFQDVPPLERDHSNDGLRMRTVMVSNVPPQLRSEKELKEYFEFYMSRKLDKPFVGLTSSEQPGFFNKSLSFLFNRAKRLPAYLPSNPLNHHDLGPITSRPIGDDKGSKGASAAKDGVHTHEVSHNADNVPFIERVVVARKMTELASLLERREEILRRLETAHIKLAKKAVMGVLHAMERKQAHKPVFHKSNTAITVARVRNAYNPNVEHADPELEDEADGEQRMEHIISILAPYVEDFGFGLSQPKSKSTSSHASNDTGTELSDPSQSYPPSSPIRQHHPRVAIWEALLSLPREYLDAYQPLVNLSHLFRGKIVPAIDYYTAKLNLLTSLITENRAKAVSDYDPVSTAFVTFADPDDARRACKYLAVHPNNPLTCLVTMAPAYEDLDWIRVMKLPFKAEFVKDWIVDLGVWAFTIFWLFPVSLLVGLVSIQNISTFWPSLKAYLDKHSWEEELIQSFLPTLLVALLALLIPLILLLIAKKAHTITTLSALHDRIMTRYYKFLVVNVLVFFCVGTAALQSILTSFNSSTTEGLLTIVADSFPSAGPFYVGWLIFTVAINGGFEIALLGLPLIMYPSTRSQVTPRKRTVGIRPRTFNYYYWLPTHLLVIHVFLVFSVLNPFVIPFATIYFFIEAGVVKNQLLHVYAKNYELNGHIILIRIVRYSLDGAMLAQVVFMAYMIVLKRNVNVGLAVVLIVFTAVVKLYLTRFCRAQFEADDIMEARIVCGRGFHEGDGDQSEPGTPRPGDPAQRHDTINPIVDDTSRNSSIWTWRFSDWINTSFGTVRHRPHKVTRRQPNPFGPKRHPFRSQTQSFSRLGSVSVDLARINEVLDQEAANEVAMNGNSANGNAANSKPNPAARNSQLSVPGRAQEAPIMGKAQWNSAQLAGPVVPHPPPVPWDDLNPPDLPYDNPFYTRAIDNALWLPRDPFGPLDLDDTVDLRTSLTTQTSTGQLGTWLGVTETASPLPASPALSHLSGPAMEPSNSSPRIQYTGDEEIDLPFAIAKRVKDGKADDVEDAIRPRRPSVFSQSTIGRRAPLLSGRASSNFRSFSGGTARNRSTSFLSTVGSPLSLARSRSVDVDSIGARPDAHAQADFVAANSSQLSVAPPRLARAPNISTQEAIVNEVLAEEEHALANRIEDEKAEAEKARTTKSWLTSWIFKRAS